MASSYVLQVVCFASTVLSAVVEKPVPHGPTGYEVTFSYTPPKNASSLSNVLVGGFPLFSDPLKASISKTNAISPTNWKPSYIAMSPLGGDTNPKAMAGLNITKITKTGNWELTIPLPSGTYLYAFYPNCNEILPPTNPLNPPTCNSTIDRTNCWFGSRQQSRQRQQYDSI